eukprot:c16325_g1_i4.p1 GENE.c16325_g1_i4~~c16325_g1_i4.p1  ORF type:complete len:299 (+),score=80.53 c16325_g1_i4:41-898(+)
MTKSGPSLSGAPLPLSELKETFRDELAQMRTLLQQEFQHAPHYDTDVWLLRFLVSRKFTVAESADRYRVMIQERGNFKVDGIMQAIQEGRRPSQFDHGEQFNAIVPERLFTCVDKYRRPCAIQFCGKYNADKVKGIALEEMTRFFLFRYEYMRIVLDAASERRNQLLFWCSVLDLQDFAPSSLSLNAVKLYRHANEPLVTMYKDYCCHLIVTDVGFTATMLWKSVKPFFPKRTTDKVVLFGSSWREDIEEYLTREEIETKLCGGNDPDMTAQELIDYLCDLELNR